MNVQVDYFGFVPTRAHETDAGLDIRSPFDFTIPAKGSQVVDSYVHVQLPPHTVGLLKSKSGLNVNYGITGEGVIDEGYTGSIKVKLYNNSNTDYDIHRGDKIIQLLVVPCFYEDIEVVAEIEGKERGDNGFGSTGR